MSNGQKVLTHCEAVEIASGTPVPQGEQSADAAVVRKFEERIAQGYVLDPGAQREYEIRKNNNLPL